MVDSLPDGLGDDGWVVGFHVDVVDDLPRLHVVSVAAVQEVEGDVIYIFISD